MAVTHEQRERARAYWCEVQWRQNRRLSKKRPKGAKALRLVRNRKFPDFTTPGLLAKLAQFSTLLEEDSDVPVEYPTFCAGHGLYQLQVSDSEPFHGEPVSYRNTDYWESYIVKPIDENVQKAMEWFDEIQTSDRDPDCLVTLRQMAAMVNRDKRTLEKYKESGQLPEPRVKGGKGRPDEWAWSEIRVWLQQTFERPLPERYPADRLRPV
jgi:hypothetical protein